MSSTADHGVCPYLWRYYNAEPLRDLPNIANQCRAVDPPRGIELSYQSDTCMGAGNWAGCPQYKAAGGPAQTPAQEQAPAAGQAPSAAPTPIVAPVSQQQSPPAPQAIQPQATSFEIRPVELPAEVTGQRARQRARGRRKLLAGIEPRFIGCALAGLVLPAIAIILIVSSLGGGSSSSDNPTPTATVVDVSATSVAATNIALASQPSPTPEPTDTHAPTPTLVATVTPSPEPSPVLTATATVTPTDTPPPTVPPTATDSPTSEPRPTKPPPPPPTNTPRQLSAPKLVAPASGAEFAATDDVLLQWQSVGTLGSSAYYVVTLSYLHSGTVWYDETPWTKGTSWLASEHSYLLDLSDDGEYTWSVRVMRQTGTDGNGKAHRDAAKPQ